MERTPCILLHRFCATIIFFSMAQSNAAEALCAGNSASLKQHLHIQMLCQMNAEDASPSPQASFFDTLRPPGHV